MFIGIRIGITVTFGFGGGSSSGQWIYTGSNIIDCPSGPNVTWTVSGSRLDYN